MYDLCECRARLPVIAPLDRSDQSLGCRQTARTITISSFMRFVGRTVCSASSSSDVFPAAVCFVCFCARQAMFTGQYGVAKLTALELRTQLPLFHGAPVPLPGTPLS